MTFAMICIGVACVQFSNSESKGFVHLVCTTVGYSLLGCAAVVVFS